MAETCGVGVEKKGIVHFSVTVTKKCKTIERSFFFLGVGAPYRVCACSKALCVFRGQLGPGMTKNRKTVFSWSFSTKRRPTWFECTLNAGSIRLVWGALSPQGPRYWCFGALEGNASQGLWVD